MSAEPFREYELNINENSKMTLRQQPISSIFKFGVQPYTCTGVSGSGKTTLCVDLIYEFGKKCTNIYYVTATKETASDNYISLIPQAFRRKPTCKNIVNIWQEIISASEAYDVDHKKTMQIIIKLYGETVAQKINNELQNKIAEIERRNTDMYTRGKKQSDQIIDLVRDDANAFKYEFVRRVILNGINEFGDASLTGDEISIVNGLVSKKPTTLLILDDVTTEMENAKTSKNKVLYNGSSHLERDVFNNVISDILTRGRHYNCLIIFFLHTIDIFSNVKDKLLNLICFDGSAAQKLVQSRTLGDNVRKTLSAGANYLFSNSKFKYMFLYYDIDASMMCVGKAKRHDKPLELNEMNNAYVKAYDNVASGFTNVVKNDDRIDIDYEYEDDEIKDVPDTDVGDKRAGFF